MRHFGPNKTALHFRRAKKRAVEAQDEEPQKYRLEEGDGTAQAQLIVRELYLKYEKQLQRWKDYRNLFLFLGFVIHFLAVLYLQRHADIAYKVHSTVESVVLPSDHVMQSTDEVYSWLNNLLTDVWKDPVCGDGACEEPFEFASYSRFGCRADCGKLNEIQNLTSIQVDIYYDFSHPVGSIPASELMQQASWNLCPVDTPYSTDCYYDSDITFDRLSGEQHYTIDDAPDGDWNLVVKRDIFSKIRGAVRDTTLVKIAGYYYKIYIAATAAMAEQDFEKGLLEQAAILSRTELWTYANSSIRAIYPNSNEYEAAASWVRNATCYCSNTMNDTTTFGPDAMLLFLNQSVSRSNSSARFNLSYDDYTRDPYYCLRQGDIVPYVWRTVNDSSGNLTRRAELVNTSSTTAMRDWCRGGLSLSLLWRANLTNTVQRLLIDRRLGDQRTTGKIAMRNNVSATMRTYIQLYTPELSAPIFTDPAGTVPLQDPISARLDYLMPLYVDSANSPNTGNLARVAALNIARSIVYSSTVHLLDLVPLARDRIIELDGIRTEVLGYPIPPIVEVYNASNVRYDFTNMTVGSVVATFKAANATNATLPRPNATLLWPLNISYNLASWSGNTTAYMRCSLAKRAPDYIGECVAMNNTCAATINDLMPYNCTYANSGIRIEGNLNNVTYRQNCEMPCDRRFDCNTLCECFGSCLQTEYCECKACRDFNEDACADEPFNSIRAMVSNQTGIADCGTMSLRRRRSLLDESGHGGRRLQQSSPTEIATALNNLVNQTQGLASSQEQISLQMSKLQEQVDQANSIAKARADDKEVLKAIEAGRQEIAAGQAAVEAKLDEILGKQRDALKAAEDAATALQAIKSLADRQAVAQANLEQAVTNQINAIRTAAYREVISLTQALALWKRARRDRALTLKAALLANMPCTIDPTAMNNFTLDNGNAVNTSTSRERNVGLTNRVIWGLLLHQTRTNTTLCPKSKFDNITTNCTGPLTTNPYGVDPVFKRGTTLYNPDFDDADGLQVRQIYDCADVLDSFDPTNEDHLYCSQLYSPQKLPYAFKAYELTGKEDGFPVYFDINLSQEGAQAWYTYINEGLYLDRSTRQMTAELVTYNAQLRIFSYYYIRFFFSDGGSIKITHRLNTVRVELYSSYSDKVRFGFEIILSLWIFGMMIYNVVVIIIDAIRNKGILKYLLSGWHWVEFASNSLLTSCIIIWWVFKTQYAEKFDAEPRYEVYNSLSPSANFLALYDNSAANLVDVNDSFTRLRKLVDMLNWYFALNGINILLLIARVLKLMDFQPRLGVVTRSLWLAGPDLIHFAIVAGMVFVGYAMMAHLIFGNAIEAFATFGDSINTCFEILLGNIDVNDDLRALGGLQSVAGALFFWSYELLVFMVLLNFLLAIIVDAFSEVKEKTQETVGIHTELFTLLRDKWRSLMGACSPNYISDAKLGDLLRQWGGSEEDEKANAIAAANKRKLLTILNEDVDEETLTEVFKECLRDAPDVNEKARKIFAWDLFRNRNQTNKMTSEQEIRQAAHYIIDRFGTAADDDNDDGDDDEVAGPEPPAPLPAAAAATTTGTLPASGREAILEKERDQLAQALERLAEVQRELAEGQRNLMTGQKQLAEQQSKLVQLMNEQPPTGS